MFHAATTIDTDKAFWIPREIFEHAFDQEDFCLRDMLHVKHHYSEHRFYKTPAKTFF